MRTPPGAVRDPARLDALRRLALLDTPAEEAFDQLTRLACKVLKAPVALVSLVDADRQFFKSCIGLPEPWASLRETPLSHSFCQHTLATGRALVIEDARTHPLVQDNLAIADLGAVAYAGIPLVTSDGFVLGTLCVIDHKARRWKKTEIELLEHLAACVLSRIELRAVARQAELDMVRYRDIFELAPVGIHQVTLEGRFLTANPALARLLGYDSPEELTARNIRELYVDPTERDRLLAAWLPRGGLVNVDVAWQKKDGTPIQVELNTHVVTDAEGGIRFIEGFVRDVSERREAGERFRILVEAALDAVVTIDRESRITGWNPQAEALFGWTRAEAMGRTVLETIIPPQHRDQHRRGLDRYLETGEGPILGRRIEMTALRRDGTEFPVELAITPLDAGGALRFSAFVRDITDRKRAEQALRDGEARLRALMDNVVDAIITGDQTGRIASINAGAERMFGYAPGELVGASFQALLADPYAARYERLRERFLRTGDATILGVAREVVGRRKDGTTFPADLLISHMGEGDQLVFIGVVRDLADRKLLEAQLRQSQKMEAVGRLAGGVAHDFNNLLTAIGGYGAMLLQDLPAGDPRRADVEEIRRAAARAAELTHQLLAFSRKQVLQPRVVDVNEIVAGLDNMLRRLIGEDVDLVPALAPDPNYVRADPSQLEQVILNLAVNARDAMPQGGKLVLETASAELDDVYAQDHVPVVPGRYVMLAVSDTGVGMDAAVRSHLFEPFFTTKETGKGTGLGLATVYGIVKQSGGYIWVYSEPGHGSTFKVYLPRVDEAPERRRASAPVAAPLVGTETILLTEDEPGIRALARKVLERSGYTVLEAATGREALDLVRGHVGPVHLVLTDVVMPEMSGSQLAAQLATERPGIRVLFMSGYSEEAIAHHGVLGPGGAYLQKPFPPHALLRAVRALLDAPPPAAPAAPPVG